MMQYLDVTYLEEVTDKSALTKLCEKIKHASVKPAGVCVFMRDLLFVQQQLINQPIKFVTVVNFPQGNATGHEIIAQLNSAKELGADEVDVVIPYQAYLRDKNADEIGAFIEMCRCALTTQTLKIILETGELDERDVYHLSKIACQKGADFIKTSTGKVKVGATQSAVNGILRAIKECDARKVGIKISGGVRSIENAQSYIHLVQENLGHEWLTPKHFRIGASTLFDAL